ncbi:adipokinetic hormone/corazonin-related peptide receptor variant I-like [Anopheles ziemanni]|uniref:adipokinetic hormone/corazonin-related peptide receptor variant I-like n=1 Tax=Anopheles coustani TaxID=139045 RepID=UPI002657BCEF|nr:adipokinetic hormone/corazonin-related peptide receptor variant I-like [Anopheles coustani]XP_058169402.1 adipokinetic hormone/corazonin-related peptide receptor variant I-like [Anopheles ziemanni]
MYLAAGLLNIMDITLQHEYLQEYYQSAAGLGNFSGTLPYGLGGLPPNGSGLQGAADTNGSEVTIAAPGHTDSTVAVIIVYCVLFVIAAGGNLSVVITLFRSRRHRRSRVSLMICHLAVADLMVAFIMIPLEVGWRITVQWHAGNVACKVFLFMRAFCLYLSSNVLVCVSLDRCFAVIYPLRVSAARKRGKIMLGGAWFIAFVNAMPQSIIFRVQQHPQVPNFTQCVTFGFFPTPGLETAYNLFCVIAMYFLPLMIISGAYTVILCEISNRSREKETSDSNTTGTLRLRCNDLTHIERARQRTLRLTITIVVVFVWCWTPYVVMTLWYMFDRESASKVDVAVQDGLFLMAVSNSCMNPLVYGSYAMKCRLPCRRRNSPGGVQTPNAAQRRSTDAVSGIIGPHSDRLTGRDNKDELLVADQRSITMNHLSQNGGIALLQSAASQLRSTGGVGLTTGAGASGTIVGTTTATTRFCNRFSNGITNGSNYHTNTARLICGGTKPATSGAHRKGGGEKHHSRTSYWPGGGSGKGVCQPSYSEFAMLADEHSLMLSRPSFYSDPTPHELDSSMECGLTRSLDTGGWR